MPVGMLRYDAWPSPIDTNHQVLDSRVSATFEDDWTSRTPTLGWGMYGTGVDAQAHATQTNQWAIDSGIDFWIFLVHLPPEIYAATPDHYPLHEDIQIPFEKYLTAPNKNKIKFALLLNCPLLRYPYPEYPALPVNDTEGGAYMAQWGQWIASEFADPQYMKIDGKPLLGFFGCAALYMPDAMYATLTANIGVPFMGVSWTRDVATATRLGLQVLTSYPPSPPVLTGNGQHPYSDVITQDTALATPSGFFATSLITTAQDQRPLTHGADPVVPWADEPTMPEFVKHIYDMGQIKPSGFKPKFMDFHPWNEHAEDGSFCEPSVQEGTRCIDSIRFAKYPNLRPNTYTYGLSTESLAVPKTGAGWTMTRILGGTVWSNREMSDSTAGDTIALTHISQTAGAIYGSKCSGCGSFTVQVDGSTVATVNTSNGSTVQHQLLWSSGTLTQATHTVQATIVGDGVVKLDEFEVTSNPQLWPL